MLYKRSIGIKYQVPIHTILLTYTNSACPRAYNLLAFNILLALILY